MRFFHQSRARLGWTDGWIGWPSTSRSPGRAPFVAVILARCWKVFVSCVVAAMPFSHVSAQTSGEGHGGLPTEIAEDLAKFTLYTGCQPMRYNVSFLPDDTEDIGISRQAVVNAVESRLRAARLYDSSAYEMLLVEVHIIGGRAYSIDLAFLKWVGDSYTETTFIAKTWYTGSVGEHRGDASFILGSLSQHMDEFLVEFLRVNESACSDPQ